VNGSAANIGVAIGGTYGSLTLNLDGSYTYAAYKGSLPAKIVAQDTFDYTVSDGHGGSDTSTLSMVVFNRGGALPIWHQHHIDRRETAPRCPRRLGWGRYLAWWAMAATSSSAADGDTLVGGERS